MKTYFVTSLDELSYRLEADGVKEIRDVEYFGVDDGYGVLVDDVPDNQELELLAERIER